MKIRYLADTDTLYVELNDNPVAEMQELNENTLIDLDIDGALVAITLENARDATNLSEFSLMQIVGQPA